MGLLRVRFEVTCSWRSWRAACCCSTPISSCARFLCEMSVCGLSKRGLETYSVFSGLECGGGAMLGGLSRGGLRERAGDAAEAETVVLSGCFTAVML